MSESSSPSEEAILAEIGRETGVAYDPDEPSVEFTGEKTDTDQYVGLVRYLVENTYITEDDLPLSAKRAQTRYLINSKPEHEDRKMVRPREVDGVHVETNHDTASKKRYSKKYIEEYVLGR